MSNGKAKAVVSYDLQVSIKTSNDFNLLEVQDKAYFSLLKNYKAKESEPLTLKQFEQRLNNYKKADQKDNNECLLKGLFSVGTSGIHNVKTAPFLFFDIDVKDTAEKKENTHLLDKFNNNAVFEVLQKIAVLVWRSNSGYGIAGILYAPQIVEFTNDTRTEHKKVGEAITEYLSKYLQDLTGIEKVTFDQAQSKFRQVRFLAEQGTPRQLNLNAFSFLYDCKRIEKRTPDNVLIYSNGSYKQPYGSIYEQFDSSNSILDIALNNGFIEISRQGNKIRVKHPRTTSKDTGVIDLDLNIFFNYSGSFNNVKGSFTPSSLLCNLQFMDDWRAFKSYLIEQGYKSKSLQENEIKTLSKSLKTELQKIINEDKASKIIFEHCYNLQTAPDNVKRTFIAENCPRPELKKYFYEYLKFEDYKLNYKHTIPIESYVSEAIPEILDYADKNQRIIVKAETGTGKTYAVINEIHKHRPEARILVVCPLTMIVNQQAKINKNKGLFITGENAEDSLNSVDYKLIFATYEQGADKFLRYESESFDYVIIDEAHNLITANAYKDDVVLQLTETFYDRKIIGLTATPLQIFNKLGFELIEVCSKNQAPTNIEVRLCNLNPYKIAVNHLTQNAPDKVLIRLNSVKDLEALKDNLIKNKLYKANEVVIFYSKKDIKKGADFQFLADKEQFNENVKIVLTTSIIDEGVNIKQIGFTDVVFIETSYAPRPEAIKQFFARCRVFDPNRKNYLYLRQTKDQTPTDYKPLKEFYNVNAELLQLRTGLTFTSSSTGIAGNYDSFIIEHTDRINGFYLAYFITDILFNYLNTEQFLHYLEINYNLSFSINQTYELTAEAKRPSRNDHKMEIAKIWKDDKRTVFNTIYKHTENKGLKSCVTLQQSTEDEKNKLYILEYLKDFEKLAIKYFNLLEYGVKSPDTILIKLDNTNTYTLTSENDYRKTLTVLKYTKTEAEPNPTDIERLNKLNAFISDCVKFGTIDETKKIKLLKKHKLFFDKNLQKTEVLQSIFEYHNYSFKYNFKTKDIRLKKV